MLRSYSLITPYSDLIAYSGFTHILLRACSELTQGLHLIQTLLIAHSYLKSFFRPYSELTQTLQLTQILLRPQTQCLLTTLSELAHVLPRTRLLRAYSELTQGVHVGLLRSNGTQASHSRLTQSLLMPYSELSYSAYASVTQSLRTRQGSPMATPSSPIGFSAHTWRLLPSYSELAPKLLQAHPHLTQATQSFGYGSLSPSKLPGYTSDCSTCAYQLLTASSHVTHSLHLVYGQLTHSSLSSSSFTHCNYSFLIGYPDATHLTAHSRGYSDFSYPFTQSLLTPQNPLQGYS